jgi:hypothetical protein
LRGDELKQGEINLDALKLMEQVTMEVHLGHARQLDWRMWLCRWLLRLACWVGGFGGIEFVGDEDCTPPPSPQEWASGLEY